MSDTTTISVRVPLELSVEVDAVDFRRLAKIALDLATYLQDAFDEGFLDSAVHLMAKHHDVVFHDRTEVFVAQCATVYEINDEVFGEELEAITREKS